MVRDMTESITRIRGTGLPGPSPLRNYASTPSDSASLSLSLFVFLLSPPVSLLLSARSFESSLSLSPPLFILLLYSHRALPSSFFKLIHPLSSFLEHQRLLSFYRVVDPPFSTPFLVSPPYPHLSAYYVIRITIICFETASTAHQSE